MKEISKEIQINAVSECESAIKYLYNTDNTLSEAVELAAVSQSAPAIKFIN